MYLSLYDTITTIFFYLFFAANIDINLCSIRFSSSISDICQLTSHPQIIAKTFKHIHYHIAVQKTQKLGSQRVCETMDMPFGVHLERLGFRPLSTVYTRGPLHHWPMLVWTFFLHATILHSASFIQ